MATLRERIGLDAGATPLEDALAWAGQHGGQARRPRDARGARRGACRNSGVIAPVARRLVVTVCPREPGVVVIPVRPGGRARRLDAAALTRSLRDLVMERRLDGFVSVCEGCAGGCARAGPNVGVTMYPVPRPGEKPDHVAIGWKTYVYSLASLDSLATIIDENLRPSE